MNFCLPGAGEACPVPAPSTLPIDWSSAIAVFRSVIVFPRAFVLARKVALPGKNGLSEIKDRAFRALTYPSMAGGSVQPHLAAASPFAQRLLP